jgi:hypothetical protein
METTMVMQTVLALAGLAVFGTAQAADWLVVAEDANSTLSLDSESLQEVGDGIARAWVKRDYKSPQDYNGVPVDSVKFNARFFCKTRQTATGQTIITNKGQTVETSNTLNKPRDVIPDSTGEEMFKAVCEAYTELKRLNLVKKAP